MAQRDMINNQNGPSQNEVRQSIEQARRYLNKPQLEQSAQQYHHDLGLNNASQQSHQWTDQQKDQVISNLYQKADCLAGEVLNLSNIVDTLMLEQKLACEKYMILKSRLNTLDKHRFESIGSNNNNNINRVQQELSQQKYSQKNKKEMYELLTHADNRSLTSPRRVISQIGIVYQDRLQSQWALRDRIGQLETELSNLRLQNTEYRFNLQNNNLLTFGKQATDIDLEDYNKAVQGKQLLIEEEQQQVEQGYPRFQNFHSVDTMVNRYS